MHAYIITRGIKHDVDRFINELSAKYLPFKFKGQDTMLQMSVRPIQFWEIAFPEEHQDVVLRTLSPGDTIRKEYGYIKKAIWGLRKMMKIDAPPEFNRIGNKLPLYDANIDRILIGTKKDYYVDKDGKHKYNPTEEEKKDMWEGI